MSIFDQKVIKYEMKPLSSLEKVFPDETPVYRMECQMLSGLWGETVSFQVAYTGDFVMRERLDVRVVSELAEHVHVRTVEMVPVGFSIPSSDNTPSMIPLISSSPIIFGA